MGYLGTLTVYQITNKINGACYVGCTWDYEKRKACHKHTMNGNPTSHTNYYNDRYFDFSFYGRKSFSIKKIKSFTRNPMQGWDYEGVVIKELHKQGVPLYNISKVPQL